MGTKQVQRRGEIPGGRIASGKERVDEIEKEQPNGTMYVYCRVSVYNKEKGYYVSIGQQLLRKKLQGLLFVQIGAELTWI